MAPYQCLQYLFKSNAVVHLSPFPASSRCFFFFSTRTHEKDHYTLSSCAKLKADGTKSRDLEAWPVATQVKKRR